MTFFLSGREYDAGGNMHKWWNNQTIERFKNRTACLVNQYSQFNVSRKNVNGNLTLGRHFTLSPDSNLTFITCFKCVFFSCCRGKYC